MRVTLERGIVTCECKSQFATLDDPLFRTHLERAHKLSSEKAAKVVASLRSGATIKTVVF